MSMRVLITGITGFAGSHLAELALQEGAEVFGTVFRAPTESLSGVANNLVQTVVAHVRPGVVLA